MLVADARDLREYPAVAEGRLLRKLIGAGARTDDPEFRVAAEEIIKEEREKKHHLLANDLERLLDGDRVQGRSRPRPARHDIPVDRERGLPLLELRDPVRTMADLVLSADVRDVLEEILHERNREEVLRTYGLRATTRVLFFGAPGCGKTSAAEALATELGLELATVRLDGVVSSYLGETAANMRKVFDFADANKLVVLFDEFDAIGKEREDPSEHGELKRVINAFLQMLDGYRGPSLLIAATNHEGLLDRALWRRFDEVITFEPPTVEQLKKLIALKLRAVRSDLPLDEPSFIHGFAGLSHADVERVIVRAIKTMVLAGRQFLGRDLVEQSHAREKARGQATKPARTRRSRR